MSRIKAHLISVSEEVGFNGSINPRVCRIAENHARRYIEAQKVEVLRDDELLRMAEDTSESYNTVPSGSWWKLSTK